ncbi:MAG: hypothetical protein R2788_03380 [Saprospiraceae bacterium]
MAASEEELNAAYFDLQKFEKSLRNNDPTDDRKLIPLFKIFSRRTCSNSHLPTTATRSTRAFTVNCCT